MSPSHLPSPGRPRRQPGCCDSWGGWAEGGAGSQSGVEVMSSRVRALSDGVMRVDVRLRGAEDYIRGEGKVLYIKEKGRDEVETEKGYEVESFIIIIILILKLHG